MLDRMVPGYTFSVSPYFNNAAPPGYATQTPSRFVGFNPDRAYTFAPVVGGLPAQVTAGAGAPADTVIWLPYMSGWVTWTRAEGRPILTGQMSGCWLARGILNGQPVFLHIGTDNSNPENNNQVKNGLKISRNTHALTVVSAFLPHAAVPGCGAIFAAQTSDNRFLAIGCTPDVKLPTLFTVKKVVEVKPGTLPF